MWTGHRNPTTVVPITQLHQHFQVGSALQVDEATAHTHQLSCPSQSSQGRKVSSAVSSPASQLYVPTQALHLLMHDVLVQSAV